MTFYTSNVLFTQMLYKKMIYINATKKKQRMLGVWGNLKQKEDKFFV